MSEAKESIRTGSLSITISNTEACVLTAPDGKVLAKIFVRQNGRVSKAPIVIHAPVDIRVSREPVSKVFGVAGTRTVEKTESGVNGQ